MTIARLEVKKEDGDYRVIVHIHYVDSEICLRMSELVQLLLFNLFHPHQSLSVEEEVAQLVALGRDEPGVFDVIEHLGSFEIFYNPNASDEDD